MYGLNGMATVLPGPNPQVLVYHSVDESGSCVSLSAKEFQRQMSYIKENGYRTLTVSEMISARRSGKRETEKTVVITFDDGLRNNYELAFPVLSELGLSATIFLATDYIGKMSSWDRAYGIAELPMLTWDMISEMDGYGIDFQSHTATHPHLPELPEKQVREELRRSRAAIEDNLGKSTDIICYPYGEFNDDVVRILKDEGYIAAMAGHPDKEDIYAVRRVGSAHLSTPLAFKVALKGGFPIYFDCRRYLKNLPGH